MLAVVVAVGRFAQPTHYLLAHPLTTSIVSHFRCQSLAMDMQPWMFDACGLMMVEERGMPWYGDDTVIPSEAWPNVTGFLNDVVGVRAVGVCACVRARACVRAYCSAATACVTGRVSACLVVVAVDDVCGTSMEERVVR